ncbi:MULTISPECIES: papain-like cysteine protease family protein [Halomonadaceae]|nr:MULTISPECIES: papain-like cysteine protease family protein [Halomonas]
MKLDGCQMQRFFAFQNVSQNVKHDVKNDVKNREEEPIKQWSALPVGIPPPYGGCFSRSKRAKDSGDAGTAGNDNAGFRLHHVPYVSQENEAMGCWYACVRMLGHSISSGPRLGLPDLYGPSGPNGLERREIPRLMENENLAAVNLPDSKEFSLKELGDILYRHGPVIFGWNTPGNSRHMSVLTGLDKPNDRIIFHDPKRGPDLTMPLDYFNERLAWDTPFAMLYSKS